MAVESYQSCGHCESCLNGRGCLNEAELHDRGAPPGSNNLLDFHPSRGGGYSQYMYLWPNVKLHRIPDHVPDKLAAMAIPFGNGWQWAYFEANIGPGKTVLIAGPGQQGLACTVASRDSGADRVIVTGLSRDKKRLEVAQRLGADSIIDVEKEDMQARVMEITNGRGVDIAIDVAQGSADTMLPLINVLRSRGTLIIVPVQGDIPDFPMRIVGRKNLTLKAVAGNTYRSIEQGLATIASGKYPLEEMATHQFGLKDVEAAIRAVARETANDAIHATVSPWK